MADISKRIPQLRALPPLLEWHPEMPTTATRIDMNKARGCLRKLDKDDNGSGCKSSVNVAVRGKHCHELLALKPAVCFVSCSCATACQRIDLMACSQQELYFMTPCNKDLGHLHRMTKATPTSPAACLPLCSMIDGVPHLPFKSIKTDLSTATLGDVCFTIPSFHGRVRLICKSSTAATTMIICLVVEAHLQSCHVSSSVLHSPLHDGSCTLC